jgi:hypothetical protein
VTPSAVSQAVRALEARIGTALHDHHGRIDGVEQRQRRKAAASPSRTTVRVALCVAEVIDDIVCSSR